VAELLLDVPVAVVGHGRRDRVAGQVPGTLPRRGHQRHARADDAVAEDQVRRIEIAHAVVQAEPVARGEDGRQDQLEHRAQPAALREPHRGVRRALHRPGQNMQTRLPRTSTE
jgi:hypothetical protein